MTTAPFLLAHSVEVAAEALSIGRSQMYELIASGAITSVKIGRRRLVPTSSLEAYLAGLTSAAGAE